MQFARAPRIGSVFAIVCVLTLSTDGGETIEFVLPLAQAAVFGGAEHQMDFELKSTAQVNGTVNWRYAAGSRTLATGELAATINPNADLKLPIRLPIPDIRDGVTLETMLTLQFAGPNGESAQFAQPMWIFSRATFAGRENWLKQLNIQLFDTSGRTLSVFDSTGIPYHPIRSITELRSLEKGLIVIGEGISLTTYRSLFDELATLAERGIPVLCLAPSEGRIEMPGTRRKNGPRPSAVALRREDIIADFDDRLDLQLWSAEAHPALCGLAIDSNQGQVEAEVTRDTSAWSWVDFHYGPTANNRLIVCGFGIIHYWEASPNARYFLAGLLTQLTLEEGMQSE